MLRKKSPLTLKLLFCTMHLPSTVRDRHKKIERVMTREFISRAARDDMEVWSLSESNRNGVDFLGTEFVELVCTVTDLPQTREPHSRPHKEHIMGDKPLVLIIHAFGGSPTKFWYRWLASELSESAEFDVLKMTEPHTPTVTNWVSDLTARVAAEAATAASRQGMPRELYLVGHSVGCQTIVRFLAEPGTAELLGSCGLKLGGCLVVAAWLAVVDPWETIEPWCSTPIDGDAVKRLLASHGCRLHVVLSDNDKYTPDYIANGAAWRERFGAEKAVIVPERAHFGGKKQLAVLDMARSMVQGSVAPPVDTPQEEAGRPALS
eukprot:1801540-Rhodomonas_salina.4